MWNSCCLSWSLFVDVSVFCCFVQKPQLMNCLLLYTQLDVLDSETLALDDRQQQLDARLTELHKRVIVMLLYFYTVCNCSCCCNGHDLYGWFMWTCITLLQVLFQTSWKKRTETKWETGDLGSPGKIPLKMPDIHTFKHHLKSYFLTSIFICKPSHSHVFYLLSFCLCYWIINLGYYKVIIIGV